jgi:predicted enzyme related to lactoylglutathione lyase
MTQSATRSPGWRHTPGTPCWASLLVHGLAEGQEFYHELFGWEFSSGPQQLGPYVRALLDGQEVAGLGEIARGRRLNVAWLPYLASDDADATAALIRERGGTVAVGPLDADSAGRMAVASDTVGATFGVWQAATQLGMRSGVAGAPGTPVWYELVVRDTTVAGNFYPSVFGFVPGKPAVPDGARTEVGVGGRSNASVDEASSVGGDDGGGLDYVTLYLDGTPVAGVHGVGRTLARRRGPHWKTYFAVADTDASLQRVVELGGQVVDASRDSPFGRVATVADREGAEFSLIAPG